MNVIQDALLICIAALALALALVSVQSHSRRVDLERMTAARDVLSAQLGEVSAVNVTNLATIKDLRAANGENTEAAKAAKLRADDATAKLDVALDQLHTVQTDSAQRSKVIYANDEAVKQWSDMPLPRALADELRKRAAGL